MGMYVGRRHSATVTIKRVLPFHCPHCAHQARALVVGIGQGQGTSPYFLDESGAKQRASSGAERAAEENAALTLKVARCPSCHKRDEQALQAMRTKVILGAVACLVALPLMGLVMDALQRASFGLYIFGPIGVITAWFLWSSKKWQWETADRRVAFVDPER